MDENNIQNNKKELNNEEKFYPNTNTQNKQRELIVEQKNLNKQDEIAIEQNVNKEQNNITDEKNEMSSNNMNNNKNIDNNNPVVKHKKCVPLEIYQKVYNDKQRLLEQLEIINNKLQSQMPDDKINLISSLQNKLKIVEKSNKSLENIVIKQEKNVINLKSKLAKCEKLLNIKSKELLEKDNIINDLNEKVEELIEINKNMKNNIKINEKNEYIKMNDIINNLKNELEINQKKSELQINKYNNLQMRYLKLVNKNKKSENEFLLKLSKEHLLSKSKNPFEYLQMKTMGNTNEVINNQNNKINNDINLNLPKIFDNNLSISINNENNNYSLKNKIINEKKHFKTIDNNK